MDEEIVIDETTKTYHMTHSSHTQARVTAKRGMDYADGLARLGKDKDAKVVADQVYEIVREWKESF